MEYSLKICNHCKGEGTVNITETSFRNRKGLINGYLYKDYGTVCCQECLGAGIVKYKIVERDKKGDIKDVDQSDANSKNLKLAL